MKDYINKPAEWQREWEKCFKSNNLSIFNPLMPVAAKKGVNLSVMFVTEAYFLKKFKEGF